MPQRSVPIIFYTTRLSDLPLPAALLGARCFQPVPWGGCGSPGWPRSADQAAGSTAPCTQTPRSPRRPRLCSDCSLPNSTRTYSADTPAFCQETCGLFVTESRSCNWSQKALWPDARYWDQNWCINKKKERSREFKLNTLCTGNTPTSRQTGKKSLKKSLCIIEAGEADHCQILHSFGSKGSEQHCLQREFHWGFTACSLFLRNVLWTPPYPREKLVRKTVLWESWSFWSISLLWLNIHKLSLRPFSRLLSPYLYFLLWFN